MYNIKSFNNQLVLLINNRAKTVFEVIAEMWNCRTFNPVAPPSPIADRHQLLQSSLQRVSESVGASDASTAPSVINVNRTPSRRRRCEESAARMQDNHDKDEEVASALVQPLIQSIRDFAKDEDRRQVALLKSQSDNRVFQTRQAQLVDEGRKYQQLIAELDPNNPRSSSLSDFYRKESLKIEEEICDLDRS